MQEIAVGKVSKYFGHVGVAALEITGAGFKVGDTLRFKGHTTDFTQTVESMQVEHLVVTEAKPGDSIGLKVKDRVRPHDLIFKVTE